MKRTASCDLQGSSPTFSAAIPAKAVRMMYSFAFVDTVQRRSAFRQPYAGNALGTGNRKVYLQVDRRAWRAAGDNLSQRQSVGDMLSIAARVGGHTHKLVPRN